MSVDAALSDELVAAVREWVRKDVIPVAPSTSTPTATPRRWSSR